jgi:signal transduction histidine kinase
MLEFLYKKPGVNLPQLFEEAPDNLQYLIRNAFDDLQRSQVQLYEHVAALQSRNKELEAYASTVAHDLKEPLYAVLLMANLITNTPDLTPAELKNYMQQITFTARQMNTTINTMLLFAKVSMVNVPVERVDMVSAVVNVLDRLSYTIKEHHAQIELPETWPVAIGFTPWIEEVWANYLINALKHGGQPPRVELGASAQTDGMVRFWIRDHGPGIPVSAQACLFLPFSQTDLVCNPSHGLGLSIVHRIIEKLGGQVGFESEAGKGSLFFFTLQAETLATKKLIHTE